MPNRDKHRDRLIDLLKSLFQLDQPDLDFGFYRIMHAKSSEVSKFIEVDLPSAIEDAIAAVDDTRLSELRSKYETARKQAIDLNIENPEDVPEVKRLRSQLCAEHNIVANRGEIYDHLYKFFERYYDNGDFLSRRYFVRETSSSAAAYAIPYDGREVMLHWANRDQLYIKSSELLRRFTFDPTKAPEFERIHGNLFENKPLKVHFRIVEGSEGERNNDKPNAQSERYFQILENEPLVFEKGADGNVELVVQFKYQSDPEKRGQNGQWRKYRIRQAAEVIREALKCSEYDVEYSVALLTPIPTDANPDMTLLDRYLNRYTARNTMDYFIHKDLGKFLRRELDFYIKNEVMHLDDIESAELDRVTDFMRTIKTLRIIGGQLIGYLSTLEDFQKRLWLKKKVVVQAHYCITMDQVPEALYREIAENDGQRTEWVEYFAIDQLPEYSEPLTIEFLKNNDKLFVDTKHFDETFKEELVASFRSLDQEISGTMISADNFHALQLIRAKYQGSIHCVYIDPPYNAKSSEILYKNSYKHSSWLCMMESRIRSSIPLMKEDGIHVVAIDENEIEHLNILLRQMFPDRRHTTVSIVHNPSGQQGDNFSYTNDFATFSYPASGKVIGQENRDDEPDIRNFRDVTGDESFRNAAANCFYPIYVRGEEVVGFGDVCADDYHPSGPNEPQDDGTVAVYPVDPEGVERKWRFARHTVETIRNELVAHRNRTREVLDIKRRKHTFNFKTVWHGSKYSSNNHGTQLLNSMFKKPPFTYPKSLFAVEDCLRAGGISAAETTVLDYFAGSGTTGHAVIEWNRMDEGERRFILVESGEHFDSALVPRILKASYSSDWKLGSPVSRDGLSNIFKYLRLESYEDTLNNLELGTPPSWVESIDKPLEDDRLQFWMGERAGGPVDDASRQSFDHPRNCKMLIRKQGTDEYESHAVDLVETFCWLIGLNVQQMDRWRHYEAKFHRELEEDRKDPRKGRLAVEGKLNEVKDGRWRFRTIEGHLSTDEPKGSPPQKVLIVWREGVGDLEEDDAMLRRFVEEYCNRPGIVEFDVLYVNGSSSVGAPQRADRRWIVKQIEDVFHQLSWQIEG